MNKLSNYYQDNYDYKFTMPQLLANLILNTILHSYSEISHVRSTCLMTCVQLFLQCFRKSINDRRLLKKKI